MTNETNEAMVTVEAVEKERLIDKIKRNKGKIFKIGAIVGGIGIAAGIIKKLTGSKDDSYGEYDPDNCDDYEHNEYAADVVEVAE